MPPSPVSPSTQQGPSRGNTSVAILIASAWPLITRQPGQPNPAIGSVELVLGNGRIARASTGLSDTVMRRWIGLEEAARSVQSKFDLS
jgi:hypothetical protein